MAGIMPFGSKERDAAGLSLVEIVGSVLEELVNTNANSGNNNNNSQKSSKSSVADSLSNKGGAGAMSAIGNNNNQEVTKFHGLRAPAISVAEYLNRISRFSGCSNPCFILSLIYIDRLITRKRIVLDPLNVHRLIITSVLLSAKFFDDHYLDNAHYAAVGGIPPRELNALEVEFAFLAEFHFHVTASDYEMYHTALANKAQAQRVSKGLALPVPQLPYQQPQTQGSAPPATTTSSSSNQGGDRNGNKFAFAKIPHASDSSNGYSSDASGQTTNGGQSSAWSR